MRLLILVLTILVLQGCSNIPADRAETNDKTGTYSAKQVSKDLVDNNFNSPTRDLNNFFVKVNCQPIDSLNDLFQADKNVQVVTKTDLCVGDCCTSFKRMTDNKSNSTFCFIKTDCGEYGFSNDQYFLLENNLSLIRNFNLGIEEWPTDSTKTLWSIEEKLFFFSNNKVIVRERKKLSYNNTTFTFDNIPFNETYGDNIKLTKEKTDEYNKILANENVEE
jgi:hypothetical protein